MPAIVFRRRRRDTERLLGNLLAGDSIWLAESPELDAASEILRELVDLFERLHGSDSGSRRAITD